MADYGEGALAALRALPETLAAAIVAVPVSRLQAVLPVAPGQRGKVMRTGG